MAGLVGVSTVWAVWMLGGATDARETWEAAAGAADILLDARMALLDIEGDLVSPLAWEWWLGCWVELGTRVDRMERSLLGLLEWCYCLSLVRMIEEDDTGSCTVGLLSAPDVTWRLRGEVEVEGVAEDLRLTEVVLLDMAPTRVDSSPVAVLDLEKWGREAGRWAVMDVPPGVASFRDKSEELRTD